MRRLSLALLPILFAVSGYAQSVAGMGGLAGVVRDASGAVVPGAQVIVLNESKGIRRTLESNSAGVFAAPALVPAAGYVVRVNKQGFAPYEAKDIEILVGADVNLNITLEIATTRATVEVSTATPLVEESKTNVSQVVEAGQIRDLPINGRRVDSFVLLTPAVVADGTYGLVSFRGNIGGNSFLTDGNDTTNQYYNENAGRTRLSSQISQDAVQEFQVLSTAYSAEYGRASGGIINTVTRSGSNDVHGTGYWFFRNQALNARDRYASYNPPETRHQAGGSIGGKIVKDKLFYFFNNDETRRDFPLLSYNNTAPLFDAHGKVVQACGATQAQCDAAIKFAGREVATLPRTVSQDLLFGKIDWRPTERHSLSASFNYLRWISPHGIQTGAVVSYGGAFTGNGDSTVRDRYGRLSYTAIVTNTAVNELRFGWFKDRQADEFSPDLIPPEIGYLNLTVAGAGLGSPQYLPRLNPSENRYQLSDNLTWTHGRHTMKYGIDFVNTEDYANSLYNQWGTYSYANLTNFALDFSGNSSGGKHWQSFSQGSGNPIVDTTIKDIDWYVQDQFRVTPSLTLNYGLRYEKAVLPQPKLFNPDYPQTGRIPSQNKNFGPRVGLAWSFNNAKTVLRVGYGLYYARFVSATLNSLFTNNGIYQKNVSLNGNIADQVAAGPVFPARLPSMDRNPPPGSLKLLFAGDNFRIPYVQQGDLAIEHQLAANTGLTVSYIWSRGKHLAGLRDANIGPEGPLAVYSIQDASGNRAGAYATPTYLYANRVDKRYSRISVLESASNSYYDGLAVQVRKRMSHGLQGSVAYTWSHAIDYNQGGGVADSDFNLFFTRDPRSLSNGTYQDSKGSSSLDQRHRLAVTSVWTPTLSSRSDWVGRFLINNWQLSQISTFASAQPTSATVTISGSPFPGAANYTLNGFGGSNRVPFWPVNSLDIDQIYRTDARLTKVLPFSDRVKTYVLFEAFNAFNHVSNTNVVYQAFQASGGVIRPLARLGNGSASAGYPDGTNARRAQLGLRVVF